MAKRPWVSPNEVRAYSEFAEVVNRTDDKLKIDISRAEMHIISYTNNKELLDDEKYPELPEEVKTAVIIVAESYAHNAVEKTKNLKTETFDDYSYTIESNEIKASEIREEIAPLLEDYMIARSSNLLNMRLRKL